MINFKNMYMNLFESRNLKSTNDCDTQFFISLFINFNIYILSRVNGGTHFQRLPNIELSYCLNDAI